eukprot:5803209-Pleurochrysis_carterae.AAC.3
MAMLHDSHHSPSSVYVCHLLHPCVHSALSLGISQPQSTVVYQNATDVLHKLVNCTSYCYSLNNPPKHVCIPVGLVLLKAHLVKHA